MPKFFNALILAFFLFTTSAFAAPLCSVGDNVQVEWQGKWYPATVTKVNENQTKCFIRYDGYGKEYDVWVGQNRLKVANSKGGPGKSKSTWDGGDHSIAAARIKVWIPQNWAIESDRDSLTANDPKEESLVSFIVFDASVFDTVIDTMDEELRKMMTKIRNNGEAQRTNINGMPAVVQDGTGRIDDQNVDWGIAIIKTPSKKVMMVMAIMETSKAKKHQPNIDKIMQSLSSY